jgi:hypothetical protein
MGSLHRHLQLQGPDHDRLAFRPDCPICQTRLSGRYPEARPLSTRQGAAAAASLVAAGTLLPAGGALADKPDRLAVPSPAAPPAVVTDDDGRSEIPPLRDDGEQVPSTVPAAPEAAPTSPPKTGIEVPRVEVEVPHPEPPEPAPEPAEPEPALPAPAPKEQAPSSEPDSAPRRESSGRPSTAARRLPPPAVTARATAGPEGQAGKAPRATDLKRTARARRQPAGSSPSGAEPATAAIVRPSRKRARRGGGDRSDQSRERANRAAGERNSERGGGASTHVVEPGQCLWVIAESLLGEQANDAQVAAEVERLWQLNADRIGTGNPDLIYPGQELRLT